MSRDQVPGHGSEGHRTGGGTHANNAKRTGRGRWDGSDHSRREEKDRHRTGARPRRALPRALRARNGPAGSSSGEPQRSTAHRARSDRGHHGLLHVPQLRSRRAGQGRADHGRDPGRGAELGAELLELRPERPLQVLGRQQRGRQGGRRRARVPLQDRADPRPRGPAHASALVPGRSGRFAADYRARRTRLRGPRTTPALLGDPRSRTPPHAGRQRPDRSPVQRRATDDARLRVARGSGHV